MPKTRSPSFGGNTSQSAMQSCHSAQSRAAILAYRNECQFMRVAEDNGNPVQAPNLVDPLPQSDPATAAAAAASSQSPVNDALLAANWLNANDRPTSGLSMSSGMVLTPLSGLSATAEAPFNNQDGGSADVMDIPISTDGVASSSAHHTPTASTTPEAMAHATGQQQTGAMGTRVRAGSTRSSYEATGNGRDATAAATTQTFFPNSNAYGMPQPINTARFGHAPATSGDEYVTSWADVSTAPSMTPIAEGVLRSLMNLGPMDAMDLSSWDQHIQ